jgi:thioredoxin reductase (NADPH)
MVVDHDEVRLGDVAEELRTRYGRHYRVITERTAAGAVRRLEGMRAAGQELALVLAELRLPGMPGTDVLARARQLHPIARRAVLIEWGDRAAVADIIPAWALGRLDYFVGKPVTSPDERFHRSVTDFLEEWWRARGTGFAMLRVVADARSARCHEIRDLLSRLDVPSAVLPTDTAEGRALLAECGAEAGPLPVVVMNTGEVLRDPSNREVAAAFGVQVTPHPGLYDVTIVGGGPAGLGAAVYAASEGLRTALLEREAVGGQAATSSMIRNYLGFPRGIRGAELAARATTQAMMFGTDIVYMTAASSLRSDGGHHVLELDDGGTVTSRAVLLATGVSYRRLGLPSLEAFLGAGLFYGAAASEAPAFAGQRVFVVGGGNSAGQAALHLARYAEHVTVLVRTDSLAESMSEYLIRELQEDARIEFRFSAAVVGGGGQGVLEHVEIEDVATGAVERVPAAAVFVLIGAEPHTDWLPAGVCRDRWGYVMTGDDAAAGFHGSRAPFALETSVPGVFAVGDVRHGSVKRVASGVGEGAACIRQVHQYLALSGAPLPQR